MYFTRGTATLYRTALRDPRPRPRRVVVLYLFIYRRYAVGVLYIASRGCVVCHCQCVDLCAVWNLASRENIL